MLFILTHFFGALSCISIVLTPVANPSHNRPSVALASSRKHKHKHRKSREGSLKREDLMYRERSRSERERERERDRRERSRRDSGGAGGSRTRYPPPHDHWPAYAARPYRTQRPHDKRRSLYTHRSDILRAIYIYTQFFGCYISKEIYNLTSYSTLVKFF